MEGRQWEMTGYEETAVTFSILQYISRTPSVVSTVTSQDKYVQAARWLPFSWWDISFLAWKALNVCGHHLQFQSWILNSLSNFVGVLKGLKRLAEAGQLQVDTADGEVHVARSPTLVTLVVQGVTCVRQRTLQPSQAFMGPRQVQVGLCAQIRAVGLFGKSKLPVREL